METHSLVLKMCVGIYIYIYIHILPKDVESSALSLLWCEACGTRGFFLQCFLISVSLPFYAAVAQVSHMIVSYPKTLKTFPLDWKYSFTLTECERCICSILCSDKVTKIGFGFGSLRKVLISYVHLRSIMARETLHLVFVESVCEHKQLVLAVHGRNPAPPGMYKTL